MRPPLLSCALLAAALPAAAATLQVEHEPITCAAPGRYVRVDVRAVPAEEAVAGEVAFRPGPASDWYRIALSPRTDGWTAMLPRPNAGLARFEYRVVLTGKDAVPVEAGPLAVAVTPDCRTAHSSAVASAIVVRVPPGAPAIPPVPPGFSPVGASGPEAARRLAPLPGKGGRLAFGAGALGVVAASVAAVAGARNDAIAPQPDDPSLALPEFTFTGTLPGPGATVSRARDTFGVLVTMEREPRMPLPITFNVGLNSVNGTRCANMGGTFEGAQRPLAFVLTGPVVPTPGAPCGESFEIRALVLQVSANQRPVMMGTVPLARALRFDP
jgi:hypothetical protein